MASLNKVMLIGNLGADPEIRRFSDEGIVANFRIATTERYKDKNGDWQENTEWHNIVAWRYLAERAEKYLKKGMQVFVEGKLTTRSWEDNEGKKRFSTEIYASNFFILGRREDTGTSAPDAPTELDEPPAPPTQPEADDDLPF